MEGAWLHSSPCDWAPTALKPGTRGPRWDRPAPRLGLGALAAPLSREAGRCLRQARVQAARDARRGKAGSARRGEHGPRLGEPRRGHARRARSHSRPLTAALPASAGAGLATRPHPCGSAPSDSPPWPSAPDLGPSLPSAVPHAPFPAAAGLSPPGPRALRQGSGRCPARRGGQPDLAPAREQPQPPAGPRPQRPTARPAARPQRPAPLPLLPHRSP